MKHNHLAVIGRLYGDDEGTIRLYAGVTESEARQRFSNDLRRIALYPGITFAEAQKRFIEKVEADDE